MSKNEKNKNKDKMKKKTEKQAEKQAEKLKKKYEYQQRAVKIRNSMTERWMEIVGKHLFRPEPVVKSVGHHWAYENDKLKAHLVKLQKCDRQDNLTREKKEKKERIKQYQTELVQYRNNMSLIKPGIVLYKELLYFRDLSDIPNYHVEAFTNRYIPKSVGHVLVKKIKEWILKKAKSSEIYEFIDKVNNPELNTMKGKIVRMFNKLFSEKKLQLNLKLSLSSSGKSSVKSSDKSSDKSGKPIEQTKKLSKSQIKKFQKNNEKLHSHKLVPMTYGPLLKAFHILVIWFRKKQRV